MAMDPTCPCTKDCPDRDYRYCKICERYKAWRQQHLEDSKKQDTAKDFHKYQLEKHNKISGKQSKRYYADMKRRVR